MPPSQPETPAHPPRSIARSIFSTAVVLSFCSALVGGVMVRDRVDGSPDRGTAATISGLVASNQKDVAGISLDRYYEDVEGILKQQYVEPITDETKLATGAVHGMVSSLNDPRSQYMDKDAFAAFQQAQTGQLTGIGADFRYEDVPYDLAPDASLPAGDTDPIGDVSGNRIPILVVNSVAPGSPADKAGVQPGDWVDSVDGHWIINTEVIARYRKLAADALKGKKAAGLDELRRDLRSKVDTAIMPPRALAILSLGSSGSVSVVWHRGEAPVRTTTIVKSTTTDPSNQPNPGGVIRLRFGKDAPDFVKTLVAAKKPLVLDLRGQPEGYFDSMVACMRLVAPPGTYGEFKTARQGEHPEPFVITNGATSPLKLTLLVDGSVRGPAAIFALALSSKGIATLSGTEVSKDRGRTVVERLPDGTGYTLVTGDYVAAVGK